MAAAHTLGGKKHTLDSAVSSQTIDCGIFLPFFFLQWALMSLAVKLAQSVS